MTLAPMPDNFVALFNKKREKEVIDALEDVIVNAYYGDYYNECTFHPCGINIFVAYGFYYLCEMDEEGYDIIVSLAANDPMFALNFIERRKTDN